MVEQRSALVVATSEYEDGAIWMALRGSSADPAEFTLFVIGYVIAETVIGRVAPSARTVRS
jgi:hypothetical protein